MAQSLSQFVIETDFLERVERLMVQVKSIPSDDLDLLQFEKDSLDQILCSLKYSLLTINYLNSINRVSKISH